MHMNEERKVGNRQPVELLRERFRGLSSLANANDTAPQIPAAQHTAQPHSVLGKEIFLFGISAACVIERPLGKTRQLLNQLGPRNTYKYLLGEGKTLKIRKIHVDLAGILSSTR